jgi:hypothetical protein
MTIVAKDDGQQVELPGFKALVTEAYGGIRGVYAYIYIVEIGYNVIKDNESYVSL